MLFFGCWDDRLRGNPTEVVALGILFACPNASIFLFSFLVWKSHYCCLVSTSSEQEQWFAGCYRHHQSRLRLNQINSMVSLKLGCRVSIHVGVDRGANLPIDSDQNR